MAHTPRTLLNRERQLKAAGLEFERGTVTLHNASETATHAAAKTFLGLWVRRAGRAFATEVEYPDGQIADVLDFGPADGKAVVYEVESDPGEHTAAEYRGHYCGPDPIRDCITIDLRDAPASVGDLELWLREFVVGI